MGIVLPARRRKSKAPPRVRKKSRHKDGAPAALIYPAYLPVPVRDEVCGLPTALSLTCKVPVLVPVWVGVKTTLIVQAECGPRLLEQVVAEILKSPVVPLDIPVSATFCLLVSVNTFATLLVPTVVAGKILLAGVKLTCT